jgi:sugar lactone lactonase YvrE
MKTNKPRLKRLAWIVTALVWCIWNLHAQSAPQITTQPASQSALAGTNVQFSVTAEGTGPLRYHWQFNGVDLPNGIITTIAGNGSYGFAGDGGAATNAELRGPNAAALDAADNIFIADWNNNRIRKVTTNGIITTVAGDGSASSTVNGQAATNTGVPAPAFAITDTAGNLYIAENVLDTVAEVATNGLITNLVHFTTVAQSLNGLAMDASGNLLLANSLPNAIQKLGTNGIITTVAGGGSSLGDGGAATNAQLNRPWGVSVDKFGTMYISDTWNNRIRKVDAKGIITTIAGNGQAGFFGDGGAATNASLWGPISVALDTFGNLLIADAFNNRVRQVDANGIITTVAGGGSSYPGDGGAATSAELSLDPTVAVDAN